MARPAFFFTMKGEQTLKIWEAIALSDSLMPNQYTEEQKIRWLSELDGQAKREVFDRCKDSPAEEFRGYAADEDPETVLLIPHPYDGVYIDWLQAQYCYYNAEFTKYGNAQTKFNNSYLTFQAAWIREHGSASTAHIRY